MMSKRKTIFYAAVPTVFTGIMAVVFLLGILPAAKAAVYEWRGIWIMGAPEYTYSADNSLMNDEAGEKKQPGRLTVGTQYGELFCERIDWRVPLYYGDSEELLTLGAGTYTGFGIPGEGKRILVGAHDTTFFSALGQLETGDFIELDTIYGSFKYRVTHTDIADVSEAFAGGYRNRRN